MALNEPRPVQLLTREQVARSLNVHPRTVGRLLESGKLAGYRVGGQWRIDPADLAAYLKGVRNIPAGEDSITAEEARAILDRLDPERVETILGGLGLVDLSEKDLEDATRLFRRVLREAVGKQ
jgi:excisionase family DNA binding protein